MDDRRSEEDELCKRLRQQAIVAELGERALAGVGLDDLMDEVVEAVAKELGAPIVSLFEFSEKKRAFVERAGVGLPDSRDEPFLPRGTEGQMGFTLGCDEPVLVVDLASEGRFRSSPRLLELGARSSVSVRVGAADAPFGVLGASSRRADDQILSGILGGNNAPDDVALLAVRPEAVPAGALSMRLPADPAALAPLRRRLGRFLAAAGATEHERFDITLCVSEAAMNAIEHAYGPADAEFEIEGSEIAGRLTVTVRDSGSWRESRSAGKGERGHGLTIMRGIMEAVEVTPGTRGTTVRLSQTLARAAGRMTTRA